MKYSLAFDVYGTLINTDGVFQSLQKMIGDKAQSFMELWRNKQLEYSFRRGQMDRYTDFSICTLEALEYSCAYLEVALENEQKESLMRSYKTLPIFSDVLPALDALEDEHLLYAFSNGSSEAVLNLLENAGISHYFKGVVSAEAVSQFKPNPLVYQHFNEVTNSLKSNSFLISGNSFDVLGAISYGMRAIWIRRSPLAVFDPWKIAPTATISNLLELSSCLSKLNEPS